jgi:ribonuclease T1
MTMNFRAMLPLILGFFQVNSATCVNFRRICGIFGPSALVLLLLFASDVHSVSSAENALQNTVRTADLPKEARQTLALIREAGPFPYSRDGAIFANRERRLPPAPRGTYREYTVPTPGSRDRGARRIIAEGTRQFWYTSDHYRSFRRIVE